MSHPFVTLLASRLALPAPVVAQVAAEVAQRCALIANRQGCAMETNGDSPLGAHIGAAILAAFAEPDTKPTLNGPTSERPQFGTGRPCPPGVAGRPGSMR